ncbi:hypothetical protein AGABI2DRAFT_64161 [Agaricus bisporus var. bisporus H97]|uniref:hypothetical protein n=1 Tax=Agaricus bisporus var. bisporus (strain H97 / ATCC MYA-4626 / FGSC 10389) TaxID=936046 RepID=UPI00029F63BE|nr:hypothetical protein AGABI2DRAFT_64161 [Agaricus bisporus var. bisporus H97]EKV49655.1 hypothetical protein AGABI2DRAFT_64161 [Agaricus bisporus var. bisporus H97]
MLLVSAPSATRPILCTTSQSFLASVVRAHGMKLMRPEKAWRPVVRMEIDAHYTYETVLGIDGQNVNLKETFSFKDADADSRLDIRVFCQSQTKKKGKRKKEVAAACGHSLGQLLKKQDFDKKLELRLQCQMQNRNTNASRGKPQNGASVLIRIRPPLSFASFSKAGEADIPPEYTSDDESGSEDTLTMPPTPTDSIHPSSDAPPLTQMLRRRVRGYAIYSDEEPCSSGEEEEELKQPLSFSHFEEGYDQEESTYVSSRVTQVVRTVQTWIAASVIPQYTQEINVPPSYINPAERAVSTFTLYGELKEAVMESEYQPIFERLQREWQYVGGLLAALAAVNAAVFAISPDSLFQIQPYALSAIAASSIASGLGIAVDAWFLFRYNWIDLKTFIIRSRDVYDSYFFFALSSRMPAVCMLFSAVALMAFLCFVAFEVWPNGVLVVCFIVGIVMSLQFLVYGVHWCANKVVAGGRASKMGVQNAVRKMTQNSTA